MKDGKFSILVMDDDISKLSNLRTMRPQQEEQPRHQTEKAKQEWLLEDNNTGKKKEDNRPNAHKGENHCVCHCMERLEKRTEKELRNHATSSVKH